MLKFVVCFAYPICWPATENGQIVFLGDKESDEWVSNFENAYFCETQKSVDNKTRSLNNNSVDCGFSADSISVIAVAWSEPD